MKTNHTLLLIFAIIVTIVVGGVYGLMYFGVEMSAQKIIKNQEQIDSQNLAKQREKSFLETYRATAHKWSELQDYYVKSNEVVSLIEKIEAIGPQSQTELNISSIDADNMDNAPFGKEGKIRMKISSRGNWVAVMKALSLVEMMPYKLNINNVRANSSTNIPSQGKNSSTTKSSWELSFDLQVAMLSATSSTTPASTSGSVKLK